MALANNKDIKASRIDREIAGYSLTGARGLYDPTVGAVSQFLKQVNPVASALGGSATGAVLNRTWQTDPTVSGSTPWLGGSYHARLQFAARLHQQHLRHAESAIPHGAQFPIHAAAVAQSVLRPESPHHRRREEEPCAFRRTIPPARDASGRADRASLLGSCFTPTTICKCSSTPSISRACRTKATAASRSKGCSRPSTWWPRKPSSPISS